MNAVGEKGLHGSAPEAPFMPAKPVRAPRSERRDLPLRPLIGAGLTVLVTLAVLLGFLGLRSLESLEAGLNDRLRVILSPYAQEQDPRISILTVTEDTLALFPYRSPVDRDFLARIVEILDAAGAKAIGIDILFDQETEPGKDDRLARAIAAFDGPAVMAWADAHAGLRPQQEAFLDAYIERSGGAAGFATVIYDADGVVRRYESAQEGSEVRSFPAMLAELTGVEDFPRSGLIDWRRETAEGAPAFQTIPSHALLNPGLPEELFKGWFGGRYVVVGADLEQLDRHRTSLAADPTVSSPTSAGAVIHAHVLSQMLDGRVVRNLGIDGWGGAALVALMAGLGALIGLAGGSVTLKLVALALTGAAYAGAAAALSRLGGPYLPIAPSLLALGLAFGVAGSIDAFLTAREKSFIRQAFSHYLEPAMVDRLARDRTSLRLGGERREISFVFTDIEGFTSMAERLEPERLTALLNDYFDGMSDIIGAHGGAIDQVHRRRGGGAVRRAHARARPRAAGGALRRRAGRLRRELQADARGGRAGAHPHRGPHGRCGGGQFRRTQALRLHRDGRRGERRGAARRLQQDAGGAGLRQRGRAGGGAGLRRGDGAPLPTLRRAGRAALRGKTSEVEIWCLDADAPPALRRAYDGAYAALLAARAGRPGLARGAGGARGVPEARGGVPRRSARALPRRAG